MPVMTLTTDAANGARVSAAFGKKLSLPGDASAAQIKADIVAYVASVVKDQERLAATKVQEQAATPVVQT